MTETQGLGTEPAQALGPVIAAGSATEALRAGRAVGLAVSGFPAVATVDQTLAFI